MSDGVIMTDSSTLTDPVTNPLFSSDDSETQAIILTPNSDGSHDIQYPQQVALMEAKLKQLLPNIDGVKVQGYSNVHGSDPQVESPGHIRGTSFPWGKVLIQYDRENRKLMKENPDTGVKCLTIEAAVEVIIGDDILQPILTKNWDASDEQLGLNKPSEQPALGKRGNVPMCAKEVSSSRLPTVSSYPMTSFNAGAGSSRLLPTTFKTSTSPSSTVPKSR
ncbi:hypothetical protein PHISCL_03637 [Aspergillus sclerotialis]|uniref:Uncharacterized protein n=1 Tax=Aspergillus sclerotialis TaxID=2070753 RepID=A0A3A2ZP65_9EURO|nr:hypothetical protein PHISCL_03637 [Aspergillus sclerotialis]